MKLPSFKRLFKGDFDEKEQNLVDKMSYTINSGIEVLYEALNKRLNFSDNFNSSQHTLSVTVDSSGKPVQTTVFSSNISGNAVGILVLKATAGTDTAPVYPTSAPFISYTQNNQSFTITNVKGLTAGISYTLTFVVMGS
jgi:hypothetical protein